MDMMKHEIGMRRLQSELIRTKALLLSAKSNAQLSYIERKLHKSLVKGKHVNYYLDQYMKWLDESVKHREAIQVIFEEYNELVNK